MPESSEVTMTGTISEIASRLGLDYATVQGLIKFLRAKNLAQETGQRRSATGRGKASIVFTIPTSFTIS